MKPICVYTPMNPTRPFYEKLKEIHHFNVFNQNNQSLFDYEEEEVLLPYHLQKEGLWRGQNVIYHFNQFYERNKDKYDFICKWDDDMIMPREILDICFERFKLNPESIGIGLFQEDYGAPNILMASARASGWYGAFSRFYMYRMKVWDSIPVECPWLHGEDPQTVLGKHSGDPDNEFQIRLEGIKHVLTLPTIHLDHRAFGDKNKYQDYRVMLDLAYYALRRP